MSREMSMPGGWLPWLAVAVAVALIAGMLPALTRGELLTEGRRIAELAWGRMLLVDVYAGMALFGAWIGWRERTVGSALAWIAALLAIGNLVACAYVVRAWTTARGDGEPFWNGARATARGHG